ncbi:MAG: hypothetical protein AAB922_03415, partial [Patescibacteria group bacterium]
MIKRIFLSILIVLLYLSTSFADTQDRLPTGNSTNQNGWADASGGSKWDSVDDAIGTPDDATSYIKMVNVNGIFYS